MATTLSFPDGDVVVSLANGCSYQLHAGVLRRNSTKLSSMLAEEHGAVLTAKAKKAGISVRYRLVLCGTDAGVGYLQARSVDDQGRSLGHGALPDFENGKVPKTIYKHYDNLFRGFYGFHPTFDEDNLATVLQDCVGLLDVAESLGAQSAVTESLDIALLRQGQVLFQSIANSPTVWSSLAVRIKSPTIMKECLIHLVGQWNSIDDCKRSSLNAGVRDICEVKHKELNLVKQAIEVRIAGHYPTVIQRSHDNTPGRTSYANDIYSWMGLSLFRHWFAQEVIEERNRYAKDGGAELYRQIAHGGRNYLDLNSLADFFEYFPMSAKAKTVFENHLFLVKEEAKDFVVELMKHNSQLEVNPEEPLAHLTCVDIDRADMPWYKKIKKGGGG